MTMERRHFDYDPLTGAYETFYYDHATDEMTIQRTEDVTEFVDVVKAAYNESNSHWKGDFHHVAAIPNTLLPLLEKQGIMTAGGRIMDKHKLRAWLNDSDNRAFRTRPGRV